MLNHKEIEYLIKEKKLVENYINLEKQLTPNGLDLTVQNIYEFLEAGFVDFSNKERKLPATRELIFEKKNDNDKYGWWHLKKGVYKVVSNEIINMPDNLIALAYTRTTLLRMGAFTQNGVWDAGFSGKSEFILVVENPFGIKLKQNSRVVQLVFSEISKAQMLYNGIYKNLGK